MDEALPRRQERPGVERREFRGLDCPSLYLCRSRRGMKRDDGQETYKLPHRLIEKKRRDRINECIAQLKDLLPEHLKLTTLGHLEKAVVLELTLKHLKALTALTEQQHQKIIALQNGGEQCLKPPLQSDLQSFHSGFQTCTKEVLQYLSGFESWTTREQQCIQLINHLHAVCTRFLPSRPISTPKLGGAKGPPPLTSFPPGGERAGSGGVKQESQPNCVPVIQRLQNWNHSSPPQPPPSGGELGGGNDTDTDSGYGGECEGKAEGRRRRGSLIIKQEPSAGRQEAPPAAKRLKLGRSSSASPSVGLSPEPGAAGLGRPDPALLGSLMALGGLGIGVGGGAIGSLLGQPPASPFCLPFYLISPAAAVASCVQPFLEKIHLEKHFCPSTSIPLVYPSVSAQATAGAFPCLSPEAEKAGSGSLAATILPPEGAAASQPFPGQPAGLKAGREWPSQSNFHS